MNNRISILIIIKLPCGKVGKRIPNSPWKLIKNPIVCHNSITKWLKIALFERQKVMNYPWGRDIFLLRKILPCVQNTLACEHKKNCVFFLNWHVPKNKKSCIFLPHSKNVECLDRIVLAFLLFSKQPFFLFCKGLGTQIWVANIVTPCAYFFSMWGSSLWPLFEELYFGFWSVCWVERV